MPLSQADRISFSLQIIQTPTKVAALTTAGNQLAAAITAAQNLDTANTNLFNGPNTLINGYQAEAQCLDGNGRSTIVEQDFLDSANKKLQNHFFPNDTQVAVPSLSGSNNIWTQTAPYALTYAIGKNYSEAYTSVTKEPDLINAILALITSAASYQDIENTSGQEAIMGQAAHCSNPLYSDQSSCTTHGGTWIAATTDSIQTFPAVVTLKSNMVTAVNTLVSFLNTEVATIVTTDTNSTNATNNSAAVSNINNTILPALSAWLGYADFHAVPGSVTTYAEFYTYNANLLSPTKLHSTQLTALSTALNARLTFVTTRLSQLNTVLGTISQNVTNGSITSSSGLYGQRYGFITLRLQALNGSLTVLAGMQQTANAQTNIISSTKANATTYQGVVATTAFQADGNGTNIIHVLDSSSFSVGDSVYIYSEPQGVELQRAIAAINNGAVTLNDVVPAKYRQSDGARMYKDLT